MKCIYCGRTDPPCQFFPIAGIGTYVLGEYKYGQVCHDCHRRLETDGKAFMAELAGKR